MNKKGDFYVVKKGINHRVSTEKRMFYYVDESKTTEHTGKVKSALQNDRRASKW
jgi:precorrin isomerase